MSLQYSLVQGSLYWRQSVRLCLLLLKEEPPKLFDHCHVCIHYIQLANKPVNWHFDVVNRLFISTKISKGTQDGIVYFLKLPPTSKLPHSRKAASIIGSCDCMKIMRAVQLSWREKGLQRKFNGALIYAPSSNKWGFCSPLCIPPDC